MKQWRLVFGAAALLVVRLPANAQCNCGWPVSAERTYASSPAEVDLPYYAVHFRKAARQSMELVAVYHRFSKKGHIRRTFISLDESNWQRSKSTFAANGDQVPVGSTPEWDPKDPSFGLKVSEGHLSVSKDYGKSWTIVPDDDAFQHPVTIKGQAEAFASLDAQRLHHYSVGSWQKLIVFAIVFDAAEHGTVYLVSNQGIFKGCDYAKSWVFLPVPTEMLFSVHSLAINPANSANLAIGTTDGVYISHDGGCTFKRVDVPRD